MEFSDSELKFSDSELSLATANKTQRILKQMEDHRRQRGKIPSSKQNRIVIAKYSHQSLRAEMKRTKQQSLFSAWNKRPKKGTEQGILIFLCKFWVGT